MKHQTKIFATVALLTAGALVYATSHSWTRVFSDVSSSIDSAVNTESSTVYSYTVGVRQTGNVEEPYMKKYRSDNTLIWSNISEFGTDKGRPLKVLVGASRAVMLANMDPHTTFEPGDYDFGIRGYTFASSTPSYNSLLRAGNATYNNSNEFGKDMCIGTVNSTEMVYATGYAVNGSDVDLITVAWTSAGTYKVSTQFGDDGGGTKDERPNVIVMGDDQIFVGGYTKTVSGGTKDFLVVCYDVSDTTDGSPTITESWRQTYSFTSGYDDEVTAMCVSSDQSLLYVAGCSKNSDTNELWKMMRLRTSDGALDNSGHVYSYTTTHTAAGDAPVSIVHHPGYDSVYVLGRNIGNGNSSKDIILMKLDEDDMSYVTATRWNTGANQANPSVQIDENPIQLMIDPDTDNLVVTGNMENYVLSSPPGGWTPQRALLVIWGPSLGAQISYAHTSGQVLSMDLQAGHDHVFMAGDDVSTNPPTPELFKFEK